jgi:hypothetical protein
MQNSFFSNSLYQLRVQSEECEALKARVEEQKSRIEELEAKSNDQLGRGQPYMNDHLCSQRFDSGKPLQVKNQMDLDITPLRPSYFLTDLGRG